MQSLQCPVTRHKHNNSNGFVTHVLQHASDECFDDTRAFRGSASHPFKVYRRQTVAYKTDVHWLIWVGHLDTVSRAGGVCHGRKDLLCHCRKYRKYDMVTAVYPKPGLAWDAEPT